MNFFFFQAEDGIRDRDVTGVQTCALPISSRPRSFPNASFRQLFCWKLALGKDLGREGGASLRMVGTAEILSQCEFPAEKLPAVAACIAHHHWQIGRASWRERVEEWGCARE